MVPIRKTVAHRGRRGARHLRKRTPWRRGGVLWRTASAVRRQPGGLAGLPATVVLVRHTHAPDSATRCARHGCGETWPQSGHKRASRGALPAECRRTCAHQDLRAPKAQTCVSIMDAPEGGIRILAPVGVVGIQYRIARITRKRAAVPGRQCHLGPGVTRGRAGQTLAVCGLGRCDHPLAGNARPAPASRGCEKSYQAKRSTAVSSARCLDAELREMGRGQVVRRGTLDPVFEGSNPSAPANCSRQGTTCLGGWSKDGRRPVSD